ncbi:MAG: tetratricopeptide repeat protein [Candidatus Omnitrophota bacterium]|nr:tetratricopeptide repeat protein [Candidatus Omnitrophota bacterium]
MHQHIVRILSLSILILLINFTNLFAGDKIEELFLRSDYPSVIEEASRILSQDKTSPNLDKVYFYLGLSNMKLGNFAEARNDFNIILREFPNSKLKERVNLSIADLYFLEENYPEAKNYYDNLAKDTNSNILSLIYYKLAQTNMKLGKWQLAKEYLEKLKNEFPLSFETSLAKNINVYDEFFTVQVGSFIDADKARNLSDEIKSAGLDSYIVINQLQDKTFYRVRVGKFASLKEAKELEKSLTEKNYPTKIFP